MELSIDTSTKWAGVAISEEGKLKSELIWLAGQNHTVNLISNINILLKLINLDYSLIKAVFVASGPGSYNGLRAGISAAKGLSLSLSVPVIGISTLEIEAYPFAFTGLPICPIHDAGRGMLAIGLYQQMHNTWTCLEIEHLTTIEAIIGNTKSETIFCGEIPDTVSQSIQSQLGEKAVIPLETSRVRHTANLASLGWQKLKSGHTDNVKMLQPVYLRQPSITKSKKFAKQSFESEAKM